MMFKHQALLALTVLLCCLSAACAYESAFYILSSNHGCCFSPELGQFCEFQDGQGYMAAIGNFTIEATGFGDFKAHFLMLDGGGNSAVVELDQLASDLWFGFWQLNFTCGVNWKDLFYVSKSDSVCNLVAGISDWSMPHQKV